MSLRWKFTLVLLCVTLVSMAVTVRVATETALGVLLRDRQSRALAAATFFAGRLEQAVVARERQRLANEVAGLRLESVGRLLVTDPKGFVLADSAADTDASLLGRQLEHVEVRSALAGESLSGVRRLPDGRYAMYSAVPVRGPNKQVAGAVVLSIDVSDIFAAVGDIRARLFRLGALIALAMAAVAYLFGSYLARPLHDLARAAGRIARGRFDERVPARGRDELAVLARAFNDMAAHLARIDETRRDFIASASHELRTPVAALKTLTDALLHDPDATVEDYREFLRDIDAQVDRLAHLTASLLTLARLDREKETMDLRRLSLGELVRDVVEWLAPEARRRGVNLQVAGHADPVVLVDRTKFERALTNLIDNAIKYGGPGVVRVEYGERAGFDAISVARELMEALTAPPAGGPGGEDPATAGAGTGAAAGVAAAAGEPRGPEVPPAAAGGNGQAAGPETAAAGVTGGAADASAGGFRLVGDDEVVRRSARVAWVRVIDGGPGIPAAELPHLFERFYRVDRARTRGEAGGAGLGLSIVREIVRLHGGVVAVASLLGTGSAFAVYWPVPDSAATPADGDRPGDAARGAAVGGGGAGSGAGNGAGSGDGGGSGAGSGARPFRL